MAGSRSADEAGVVEFRFYAELSDFLPPERRQVAFTRSVEPHVTVKDAIESLGVPHPEVDLVLVNGASAGFERRLRGGDRVAVYPVFELFDIGPVERLRPEPLRETRFIADVHLGTLARLLRLLGFDTAYDRDADDATLAERSVAEGRIILTRDRGLLKRREVTHGYFVRAAQPREQLTEVVARFDLADRIAPFTRCMRCNGEVHAVEKGVIEHRLLPKTRRYYDIFRLCSGCGRIYWNGSHARALRGVVEEVRARLRGPTASQ